MKSNRWENLKRVFAKSLRILIRYIRYVKQYRCKRCKFNFTEKHDYCPICEREGVKVELEPRWMKII